jgi:hypothetical protein
MSAKKAKKSQTAAEKKISCADFITPILEELRAQQEECEKQAYRGRRILNFITQLSPVEDNVAKFIIEKCSGFGDAAWSDVVVCQIGDALTEDQGANNGKFVEWFLKLTKDIVYEETTSTLWCREDAWHLFLCFSRYMKMTKKIESHCKALISALKRDARGDNSDDGIDWNELVLNLLNELDNDPFVGTFTIE